MSGAVRMCRTDDAEQICMIIRDELGYTDITADKVLSSLQKIIGSDD